MNAPKYLYFAPLFFVALLTACAGPVDPAGMTEYDTLEAPLQAYCDIIVKGKGTYSIEEEYIPGVVTCENGAAPMEALKAQAVAARSFAYYKIEVNGAKAYDVEDGTQDQVFSCSVQPQQKHYDAVAATSGQVLRYSNTQLCAFYVAGAKPSNDECLPVAGDNDWSNTEKYVTYNWGMSGGNVNQSPLGWINSGNYANRGCMSQNGSACLASQGWNYIDILKFYYGMDIEFVTAEGSCVQPPNCVPHCSGTAVIDAACELVVDCAQSGQTCEELSNGPECVSSSSCQCNPGETLSEACGLCGKKVLACGDDCQWVVESGCQDQGMCSPGAREMVPCGDCGLQVSTCDASCRWGAVGPCEDVASGDSCNYGTNASCNDGIVECVGGSATCVSPSTGSDEVCDGLDNDCDGLVDEDAYVIGSDVPWAAEADVPGITTELFFAERQTLTITFENLGGETWPPGGVSLMAAGSGGNGPSALQASNWLDGRTAAVLAQSVAPGGTATFSLDVQVPADAATISLLCPECVGDSSVSIQETFYLAVDGAGRIRCPTAGVEVVVSVDGTADGPGNPSRLPPHAPATTGGGCRISTAANTDFALSWLLLSAFAWLCTRRRDAESHLPA